MDNTALYLARDWRQRRGLDRRTARRGATGRRGARAAVGEPEGLVVALLGLPVHHQLLALDDLAAQPGAQAPKQLQLGQQ